MDWGLILVVLAIVFLVGHLALDGYRTFWNLRFLRHVTAANLNGEECVRCRYIEDRMGNMRHEAFWTAAAIVVLAGHITLDFVA